MRKMSYICTHKTVIVAQLVRASDCGSEGRGFETPHSPKESTLFKSVLFYFISVSIITETSFFTFFLKDFSIIRL
ncbi:protein of unknown function [Chryseobacterium sp. JV274]|nr:protein of unknown function [Chryseobacterium sp. JV274]